MIDREALAAALETFQGPQDPALDLLIALGHRTLAQLPEKCKTCGGAGTEGGTIQADPFCHGKGFLYPAALVERIAKALRDHDMKSSVAVAVLDALNTEAP